MRVPSPPIAAVPTAAEDQPMRVGANAVMPDVLRDLGHDPAPVFAAAGLDMAAVADADATLSMHSLARLMKAATDATGRQDLGLRIAARAGISRLGLLWQRLSAEPDIRGVLATLMRFAPINTRAAAMRMTSDDSEVRLEMAINDLFASVATPYEEAMVTVTVLTLRQLMGEAWRPAAIEFARHPSAPIEAYRRIFGMKPRFNQLRSAIVIRTADLSCRLPGSSGEDRQALDSATRAAATRLGLNVEDQTRALIRANLSRADLSVEFVASVLGLSSRTLNRRLLARGVSFAGLLRDTRFATARHLLAEAETSLGEIATALGYTDQSAFSRAFRLWSGTSPRAWRQAHAG